MGLACPNCNGMGTVDDEECPQCVGGEVVTEREPFEVTPEFKPAIASVTQLPPSTATPDGNIPASTSGQGGAVVPEGVTNPSAPEDVEVDEDTTVAGSITDAPNAGGAVVVNEEAKEAAVGGGEGGGNGYESWTNADLQTELEGRGLATSGNKAELVARLEESDSEGAVA